MLRILMKTKGCFLRRKRNRSQLSHLDDNNKYSESHDHNYANEEGDVILKTETMNILGNGH